MAKKIDNIFARFNQLLLDITVKASLTRQRYAKELLSDLYQLIINMQARIDQHTGRNADEYDDLLTKTIRLLQVHGYTQVDLDILDKPFIDWLNDKLKNVSENQHLTYEKVRNIHRLYGLSVMDNEGKEPAKLSDLKQIIKEYNLSGYDEN